MSFAQDLSNHLGRFHRQAVCGILIQDHSFSFLAPYSSYGAVSSSRIVVAFALGRIACLELQDHSIQRIVCNSHEMGMGHD